MDFNTILGSSVMAALISALIAAYGTRRQDKLKYITSERKEWRSDSGGSRKQFACATK